VIIVLLLVASIAVDAWIAHGTLSRGGPDVALEAEGIRREGDTYVSRFVIVRRGPVQAEEVVVKGLTTYGERFEREVVLEGPRTRLSVETETPLESIEVVAPPEDADAGNDRLDFAVWSHEMKIGETAVLPDSDVALVGEQVWTAYADRSVGRPPAIFLRVNDARTGEEIAYLRVSDIDGFTWSPRIVPERRMIYWGARADRRLCVQYTVMDENLHPGPRVSISSADCDLIAPAATRADDGGVDLTVAWERSGDFGFRVYDVERDAPQVVVDTGSVRQGARDDVLYRPTIKGVEAYRDDEGFVILWLEKEGHNAHINFIKISSDGDVLVPRRELASYYMGVPYWRDFEVAFLPGVAHVFWTEMNAGGLFQVSRLVVDYSGEEVAAERIVAEPAPEFRGAIDAVGCSRGIVHLVWVDQNPIGTRPNRDVFYQRFDAAGDPLGERRVLVSKPNSQKYPKLHVARDGERVLQWSELAQGGGGYVLLLKSTGPELVAALKTANRFADLRQRLGSAALYAAGGLAAAALMFLPFNLLPLLFFGLFYYVVVRAGKIEQPMYYLPFPFIAFPAKFYNDMLFKSALHVSGVGEPLLLFSSAAALVPLAAAVGFYILTRRQWYFGRFRLWFGVLLFLQTAFIAARWIQASF